MNKFWIIAAAGFSNTLWERFTSYEAAKEEAKKRAERSPGVRFNILELGGVALGTNRVDVDFQPNESDISIYSNTDSLISIELTNKNGEPFDLQDLHVQFIVLPNKNMNDVTSLFNETKIWISPEQDPYVYNGFQSNIVEYLIDKTKFTTGAEYWYQVRLMYDGDNESSIYKEGKFIVSSQSVLDNL